MSKASPELEYRRGYYLAVANIVRTHGDGVIAEDVLRNYGRVNLRGIDPLDVETLKPVVAEIQRKLGKPRRMKSYAQAVANGEV